MGNVYVSDWSYDGYLLRSKFTSLSEKLVPNAEYVQTSNLVCKYNILPHELCKVKASLCLQVPRQQ
jgi:hypothetical protein